MSADLPGGTADTPPRSRTARPSALQQHAARLWPDNEQLQREWMRAVRVVRSTRRGWVVDADQHQQRRAA